MALKNKLIILFSLVAIPLFLCTKASAIEFDGKGLSEDGAFHLYITPPTTMDEKYYVNEMISDLTSTEQGGWGITSGGEWNCNEDFTSCKLVQGGTGWTDKYYDIIYEYDPEVKARVDEIMKNFEVPENGFYVHDTELLEYLVFGGQSLASFSSEVKESLDNMNFKVVFRARGGGYEELVSHNIGTIEVFYNETIYAVVGGMPEPRAAAPHIFYVPSGVSDEDLADALMERLVGIYGEELEDVVSVYETDDTVADLIDPNSEFYSLFENYLNKKVYELDIDFGGMGDVISIVIISDSDKVIAPSKVNSTDLLTNINISADSALLPDDAMTYAEVYDEVDNQEEIEEILGTDNFSIYEIGLYSFALNEEINDNNDDNFVVSIPIPENLKDLDNISAYWINRETKEAEEHRAKIEGDKAVFETNHFSTYILAESTEEDEEEGEDTAEGEEKESEEDSTKSSDTGRYTKDGSSARLVLPIIGTSAVVVLGLARFIVKKVRAKE